MRAVGLDIGTTKLCALALDEGSGAVLKVIEAPAPALPGRPWQSLQDAAAIGDAAAAAVAALEAEFAPVRAVGVSGAMHGILYLDEKGKALGPLHTWQDQSAAQPAEPPPGRQTRGAGSLLHGDVPAQSAPLAPDEGGEGAGETYCQRLSRLAGAPVPAGYGLATLYTHLQTGQVPAGAAAVATIGDYAALRLAGAKRPVLHPSMAASLGLFDVARSRFDENALQRAGLPAGLLPAISDDARTLGHTAAGAPVFPAVGDSQAAFAGAVQSAAGSLLVNIGTGSQLALVGEDPAGLPGLETRPFFEGLYLYTGAALCGGSAWAMLERFFRQVAEMAGASPGAGPQGQGTPIGPLYAQMAALLEKGPPQGEPLRVDTAFLGTRQDPARRGAICGIGPHNLTPAHLAAGFLAGMAAELRDMYAAAGPAARRGTLVAAGGAVRKNPALALALHQAFGLPPRRPAQRQEAARGAAIAALAAAGRYESLQAAMGALNTYES